MKPTTKVIAVALFAAFVLALVLVSSTSPGVKLRGGSPGDNDALRDAQVFEGFSRFLSFLSSLLRRIVALILSLPTKLFQYIISWFFFVWDLVVGVLVSVSSPFATTTTTTLSPVTSQPQATTTSLLTSLGSMASPTAMTSTSSEMSMMSSVSSTPTVPIGTTTASISTSTAQMTTTASSSALATTALPTTTTTTTALPTTTTTTQLNTTTTTTPMPFKTVFVTSGMFNGSLGGLEGADLICSEAAMAGSLTGKFLPWLSNASHSPNSRFTKDTLPYKMIGGKIFANNYDALVAAAPLNNLDIQEDGQMTSSTTNQVWTGTFANGNARAFTCSDWTSTSGSATYGVNTLPNFWTNAGALECTNEVRLYCFEQ